MDCPVNVLSGKRLSGKVPVRETTVYRFYPINKKNVCKRDKNITLILLALDV